MLSSKTITLAQISALGACNAHRERFAEVFGNSVELTEEVINMHYKDFDISWCVGNLLSEEEYRKAIVHYADLCDLRYAGTDAVNTLLQKLVPADAPAIDVHRARALGENAMEEIRDTFRLKAARLFYKHYKTTP
jgi:hypothetical protein